MGQTIPYSTAMDYFGPVIYPSDFALPYVDHLHERPHPHQSLLQYLAHRKPNLAPQISQPDVDIRDTPETYYIEVELPGITDKNAVKIEWTSSRSLLISGSVDRPFVEDSPAPAVVQDPGLKKTGTRDLDGNWVPPKEEGPVKPTLVVNERRIGPFRRHFNFPVDVDMKGLKARLEAGLLKVQVHKKKHEDVGLGRVSIE
jgi:HSP20 family molecular chaperone IbpA